MTIKSDDDGNGFVLLSVGDGLANDLLMAEMDAVENADGDTDLARAGVLFVGGANDVHLR